MEFQGWTKEAIAARFAEYVPPESDVSRDAKKRRAILAAGYHLFLRHGYRKTSIDEVAKGARVAKGTVYLYFKNKAELLVHCIAFEKQMIAPAVTRVFAKETPDRDRLRLWLKISLSAVRDMPLSARLMTGDHELLDALDDASSEKMQAMRKEGHALAVQLLELAAPGTFDAAEKARRADVLISLGFLSAHFLDPRMRNELDLDAYVETLLNMVLYGALHRPAPLADGA